MQEPKRYSRKKNENRRKLWVKNEYQKVDFETSSLRIFPDNSVDHIVIKQVLIKNRP